MKAFLIFALLIYFTPSHAQTCASTTKMITAARLHFPLDSTGLPDANAWQSATSTTFCTDWQGHNPDPQRQTEVRLLWSPEALFIRFHANYRDLYVYPGGPQRRDHLWDRDVAETFLQPPHQSGHIYSEIEVAPNGDWIDLAIANGNHADLHCTMKPRVAINREHKTWTADLALPMKCLAPHFDPKQNWRANFFRIEGPEPNRFYSSWQPTNTPQPNFHVPEAFAQLTFQD